MKPKLHGDFARQLTPHPPKHQTLQILLFVAIGLYANNGNACATVRIVQETLFPRILVGDVIRVDCG